MKTEAIESMIAERCADSDAHTDLLDLLAAVAERHGVQPAADDLSRGAGFVVAYVEQVPYMMKVAETAAASVGLTDEMQRILERIESYWMKVDDVIPDQLGVIGLLDDAYCSLASLQTVSDHYQLQTGKHLFPNDLSEANRAMRRIIGEPYASELDRIVVGTMKETGLIEAAKRLASEEKRLNFAANSTIWNHGPAGQAEIGDLANLGILDD